jgi:Lon protease-like protein
MFGMIMPPRPSSTPSGPITHVDYGTMLEIRSVQILDDGRSLLETWGVWRFRLVEKDTRDGYMVGRVER